MESERGREWGDRMRQSEREREREGRGRVRGRQRVVEREGGRERLWQ